MVFRIDEIRANIEGLSRPAHYNILIALPPALAKFSNSTNTMRKLALRAEAAEIPGRSLATSENRIYGPIRKMPYSQIYADTTMSFHCDHKMNELKLFNSWMSAIIDPGKGVSGESGALRPFNVKYYSEYTTTIEIQQFDEKGNISYVCKLLEAFPIIMAALPLSWASVDEYHKLQISFAYRYWTGDDNFEMTVNPSLNIFDELLQTAPLVTGNLDSHGSMRHDLVGHMLDKI